MPRVATFCPRCGESIETQVPDVARSVGRAEVGCPACQFRFVIAPAQAPAPEPARERPAQPQPTPEAPPSGQPGAQTGPEGAGEPTPPPPSAPQGIPQATAARPTKKGPSGALPARLLSAGLLLFFVAAVGLFYAIVFSQAPAIFDAALEGPAGSGEIEGVVVSPGRDAIVGAQVALLVVEEGEERPDLNTPVLQETLTDEEGGYSLSGVDPGVHWLRISLDGHRTTFFQTWALSAEEDAPGQPDFGATLWEVVLREGAEDDAVYQTQQVSLLETMLFLFQVSGWIAYPASILAGVAGVFILVRRSFPIAVTGCVAGMLSVGFLVGGLMALVALILVLTARREFTPIGKKRAVKDEWGQ